MQCVHPGNPDWRKQQHQTEASNKLHQLAQPKRPQAAAGRGNLPIADHLQAQRALLLQFSVEGPPRRFEVVQFHAHLPTVSAVVTSPRSLCLMRLIFVATLVSLMPSMSAISAYVRSSK